MTSSRTTSGSFRYNPRSFFRSLWREDLAPPPTPPTQKYVSQTGRDSHCNPIVNHREATAASKEKRTFPMAEAEKAGLTKHVQSITKSDPEGFKVDVL